MIHRRILPATLVLLAGANFGCHGPNSDTVSIVTNARIWTGDPQEPTATALVVQNGRFVFVGNDDDARAYADDNVRPIDANGARIIPGLIDAHLHLVSGGLQLSRINLREVEDRDEFIREIAEQARAAHMEDRWILGGRWSTESWPDPTQPRKEWIDPVTPNNPVLLSRMDGHGALANSVALKLAGIDREGPADPIGGEIVRDPATGEPTGILRESAIGLVSRHIPAPSAQQLDQALTAAMRHANQHGITGVHTMSPWEYVAVFDRARSAGRLTLRIRQYVSEADWTEYIDKVRAHRGDDRLRLVGFKQFMDGSLGSRTAYMARPFADNPPDQPNRRGLLREVMHTEGELQRMCNAAHAAGLTPAIHAIGDQANHIVLNTYERLRKTHSAFRTPHSALLKPQAPSPKPQASSLKPQASSLKPQASSLTPLRIEHAQHLLPADIQRFASLGVIASMQPLHKADDGRYAEKAIGPDRCQTSYAFRSLLDAGAHVAFGSDWPVVSLNPFLGIHAATTGETLDGKVFVPEQNITVEEALRAYTTGAAAAAGEPNRLGRIKPGYLADFVILEEDPLNVSRDSLKTIHVSKTYVEGRQVWPER